MSPTWQQQRAEPDRSLDLLAGPLERGRGEAADAGQDGHDAQPEEGVDPHGQGRLDGEGHEAADPAQEQGGERAIVAAPRGDGVRRVAVRARPGRSSAGGPQLARHLEAEAEEERAQELHHQKAAGTTAIE